MPEPNHIVSGTQSESVYINDQLLAYNHKAIPYDSETYKHELNFVIKNSESMLVAGLNALLLGRYTLALDILWVHPECKGEGLGTKLLEYVESEAKKLGAVQSVLYTYDFQAKDFYIKHGYEVFGVLDDCPVPDRKRYYMKKLLKSETPNL